MRKIPLVRRQLTGSLHQAAIFVLCVVLSLVTLVSLSGFSRSVHSSFLKDARALHAADIILHAHSPFSGPLLRELSTLEKQRVVASARIHEFYSIVRTFRGEASLLSNLKVADPGYPFYGTVQLASGRPFNDVLTPGGIVVEQALLDRLHLRTGDRVRIGKGAFTIRDVVLLEPDRPVNFFSLGPRVFIPGSDLASLDLVGKGSRVNYTILVKVTDQKDLDRITLQLKAASLPDRERVETYRTAGSGVKRFFDNFLFFLNLIGIQSSLTAFLKEQERTIAVMKAVGAESRFIIRNYFALVSVLGLTGTIIGLGASFLLERFLPGLFQGLLPANIELVISASAIAEGVVLGCVVVVLFTILPLLRLKEVKPRAIFGEAGQESRNGYTWLFAAAIAVFFSLMVLWRLRDVKTGFSFVLGVGSLIVVSLACAEGILRLLRILRPGNLVLRQALKGLFRPRNATRAIMVTLAASLAVIFSITLVEKNLDASFVSSYPPDSPNVFFIDIQPVQKKAFARELGMPAIFYPLVRGTVTAINDDVIDREQAQRKRGDNLGREFNLTYRVTLLDDERIIAGRSLYQKSWQGPQVSVLDTVLEMRDMKVGDRITFRIQGIPLEARISSIRTRTRASLQPFFYFVFPAEILQDAPHTLFTALRIEQGRIPPLQNRLVSAFPNVSVIDVTGTIASFSKIMARLSMIVNFFTLFSVVAGILIIISSVFATRYTRIQEAVFYTILGARGRFVLAVFAVEGLLIGLASSIIALALAQTTGWIVCTYALDMAYQPFAGTSLIMALVTLLMVIAVGLGAAVPILRHKPAAFLREQAEE
jgi:putative ABC transport system permease protein